MNNLDLQLVEYERIGNQWEVTSPSFAPVSGIKTQAIGSQSHIDQEQLFKEYEDANATYDIIRGEDGRKYEYFVLNPEQIENGLVWLPSTSFSGALKNPANVLEACLSGALNSKLSYMYVTSFGNYPTGLMSMEDMRYMAKTGRLTTGDGQNDSYRPLPSIQDMAETFSDNGLLPTHFSANEEAGRLALALMSAFEKDTTKQVFLNGLDGISKYEHYLAAPFVADIKSRVYRRSKNDSQPGELTPPQIKELKSRIPAIYKGLRRYAHLAPIPAIAFPQDVFAKAMLSRGFGRHNDLDQLDDHALFHDFRAGWLNQAAQIDMNFNIQSSLHDVEQAIRFGQLVLNSMPSYCIDEGRQLKIYISQGNHNQHTDQPHDRVALERLSFREYLRELRALSGVRGIGLAAVRESQNFTDPTEMPARQAAG